MPPKFPQIIVGDIPMSDETRQYFADFMADENTFPETHPETIGYNLPKIRRGETTCWIAAMQWIKRHPRAMDGDIAYFGRHSSHDACKKLMFEMFPQGWRYFCNIREEVKAGKIRVVGFNRILRSGEIDWIRNVLVSADVRRYKQRVYSSNRRRSKKIEVEKLRQAAITAAEEAATAPARAAVDGVENHA